MASDALSLSLTMANGVLLTSAILNLAAMWFEVLITVNDQVCQSVACETSISRAAQGGNYFALTSPVFGSPGVP